MLLAAGTVGWRDDTDRLTSTGLTPRCDLRPHAAPEAARIRVLRENIIVSQDYFHDSHLTLALTHRQHALS
jgi:hypothetical protein